MNTPLAIVIPAYKGKYLEQTLSSIAQQNNQNFNLYLGDDASPDNLKTIVAPFEKKLSLQYHNFKTNLGSVSLVKHWERCISLSGNEPYIWLFSDDDLMPPDAVERFYQILEKVRGDVYRYGLELIDSANAIIASNSGTPEKESGLDFIIRRLKRATHSAMVEFIFSRDIYDKSEGFIEFPLAWGSDTATMAKFSEESGITRINGTPVQWRTGDGYNISSSIKLNQQKLEAQDQFIRWVLHTYKSKNHQSELKKILPEYIDFVCTGMLKGNISISGFIKIYKLGKSGKLFTWPLFSTCRMMWKSKVSLRYRKVRRYFVRLIRKAV